MAVNKARQYKRVHHIAQAGVRYRIMPLHKEKRRVLPENISSMHNLTTSPHMSSLVPLFLAAKYKNFNGEDMLMHRMEEIISTLYLNT